MKILFVDEFEGKDIAFGRGGWFNATQSAGRFGRDARKWLLSPGVDAYLDRLAQKQGVKKIALVQKSRQRDHGGYWMHPVIAPLFGRWLDEGFADWLESRVENAQEYGEGIRKALRLNADYLSECLQYEPTTGLLVWREDRPASHFMTANKYQRWHDDFAGKIAGYAVATGYLCVYLDGIDLKQHHVVLAMHGTRVAEGMEVDHLNGVRSDNRMENLRVVPHAINMKNKVMSSQNTSGVNGVRYVGGRKPWAATGTHSGHHEYIGSFNDISEAKAARLAWQEEVGGFTKRHGTQSLHSRYISG